MQFAVSGSGNIRGQGAASGVFQGGLSGVALGAGVGLLSRVTQGCLPISPARLVTQADRNVALELDGDPALDVLLRDLNVSLDQPEPAMQALRATLVGLMRPESTNGARTDAAAINRTGNFGNDLTDRKSVV